MCQSLFEGFEKFCIPKGSQTSLFNLLKEKKVHIPQWNPKKLSLHLKKKNK